MLGKLIIFQKKIFLAHKILIMCFLLLYSNYNFLAAQPQFSANLSITQALIGDTVTLTLQATTNPNTQVFFQNLPTYPLPADSSLEILTAHTLRKQIISNKTQVRYTQKFIFTAYDSAIYTFPPFTFKYLNNNSADTATFVTADSLKIFFNTPKIDVNAPQKDISPIINAEPSYWRTYLKYFFLAIANIWLFYIIYKKLKNKKQPEPKPTKIPHLTPYQQATLDLRNLAKQQLWQNNEVELYYIKLTHILRAYLQGKHNINATMLTSHNTLDKLIKTVNNPKYTEPLEPLFNTADLVKFAQLHPQHQIHPEMMQHVVNFIVYEENELLKKKSAKINSPNDAQILKF